jgi:lysophospholipase L1-like esterase
LLAIIIVPLYLYSASDTATFIPASHPDIRYTGRFDKRDPEAVRFDWPGSMIDLRFAGTSCAVKIRGDGGLYDVHIGDSLFAARFDTLENTYKLVENLPDTVHRLKIVKRFEGMKGQINVMKGFYIDAGKSLHPLDLPPTRKIEFIGGSNLLGFGVEADTIHCDTPSLYSNASLSFGAVAARELGAQLHIVAISGKGVSRNWQTPGVSALRPFGLYYDRALRNDSLLRWDFKSWVPDVVVINHGINDFSTRPHTPKMLFISKYRSFIDEILARNPNAYIICMTSSREPLKAYVSELVVTMWDEGNTRVRFYSFAQVPKRLSGCDWHPNVQAQEKIGKELADIIRPLLRD